MTVSRRAALYPRVSMSRQAEHDVSIPDQKRQGENYRRVDGRISYARRSRFRGDLAEREGFEPSVPVRVQRFSRPSRSTTPAPLLAAGLIGITYPRRNRVPPIFSREPASGPGNLSDEPQCQHRTCTVARRSVSWPACPDARLTEAYGTSRRISAAICSIPGPIATPVVGMSRTSRK